MDTSTYRTYVPTIIATIILFSAVIWAYASAKSRPSTIVLPGGITYLGPSSTPIAPISPISPNWTSRTGTIYPYSFDYPSSLSLGVFPNDPFDSVTAFIEGTDGGANIFFRVEPCNLPAGRQGGNCGIEYAQTWWKQYNWKGISSVTTFTNKNGLKGYRTSYLDQNGQTPYDHVFFDVPRKKDLIIWISGRLFSKEDFAKLVDSVRWNP